MSDVTRAYVGLGGNLGDAVTTLRLVLDTLQTMPGIHACTSSPFYRTAPIDSSGPDYVNAVAAIDTTLEPLSLLDTLQSLENQHGRERPYRNAPRTLDLDLLLYGDLILDTPRLTVPHPRMQERAFVLAPLHDLAPDLVIPAGPVASLLADLPDQGIQPLV